ncbi:hypothetical protein BDW68DRAFT_86943 [Aspergillus falconensis]
MFATSSSMIPIHSGDSNLTSRLGWIATLPPAFASFLDSHHRFSTRTDPYLILAQTQLILDIEAQAHKTAIQVEAQHGRRIVLARSYSTGRMSAVLEHRPPVYSQVNDGLESIKIPLNAIFSGCIGSGDRELRRRLHEPPLACDRSSLVLQ